MAGERRRGAQVKGPVAQVLEQGLRHVQVGRCTPRSGACRRGGDREEQHGDQQSSKQHARKSCFRSPPSAHVGRPVRGPGWLRGSTSGVRFDEGSHVAHPAPRPFRGVVSPGRHREKGGELLTEPQLLEPLRAGVRRVVRGEDALRLLLVGVGSLGAETRAAAGGQRARRGASEWAGCGFVRRRSPCDYPRGGSLPSTWWAGSTAWKKAAA